MKWERSCVLYFGTRGVCYAQHACCARFESSDCVSNGSDIISAMDDRDFCVCKLKNLTTFWEITFHANL